MTLFGESVECIKKTVGSVNLSAFLYLAITLAYLPQFYNLVPGYNVQAPIERLAMADLEQVLPFIYNAQVDRYESKDLICGRI